MEIHANDQGRAKGYYHAYLNGKKVNNCFYASEEKGIVKRYKTDDYNNKVILKNPDGTMEVEEETLRGEVKLVKIFKGKEVF